MARPSTTELLGKDAQSLLTHKSKTISKANLHLPGPDFVDRIFSVSNRNTPTLISLQTLFNKG
ncbi:MAG: fructose-bisphosphate aldolase, partial [Cyclobacteriaceae bacterium]|nr:fructose-bisphosphate aldolase [Cyclobacteriaceae bacterium]